MFGGVSASSGIRLREDYRIEAVVILSEIEKQIWKLRDKDEQNCKICFDLSLRDSQSILVNSYWERSYRKSHNGGTHIVVKRSPILDPRTLFETAFKTL